jgi:steroid delta-isomerase-like uncharacterized protein
MNKSSVLGLIILLAIGTLIGCCSEANKATKNKEILLQAFEVMNNKEYDRYQEFFSESFKRHSQATPDIEVNSLDDMIGFAKQWDQAFPDAGVRIRKIAAEGNQVAIWVTYAGTHTAPMGDIPATGKRMESETFGFFRFENNMIAEAWVTWDNVAVLKQLGLFPEPPAENP